MSTNGKEYDEFDDFAKNIIDEIVKFGVGREEAVGIFNKYLPVYEVLAEDHLEDESFYAAQFHDAYSENFMPEQWMEKIQKIDVMFGEEPVGDDLEEMSQSNQRLESTLHVKRLPNKWSDTEGWVVRPPGSRERKPLLTFTKKKPITKNE